MENLFFTLEYCQNGLEATAPEKLLYLCIKKHIRTFISGLTLHLQLTLEELASKDSYSQSSSHKIKLGL